MDEVMYRVETPVNILHEVPIQMFTTDTTKFSDSVQSPMSKKLPLKSNLDIEEPTDLSTERIRSSKMQLKFLQEDDTNRQNKIIHDLSSPEIILKTKNDPEFFYLVGCIKLHQASTK